jgi:hypothetical protein
MNEISTYLTNLNLLLVTMEERNTLTLGYILFDTFPVGVKGQTEPSKLADVSIYEFERLNNVLSMPATGLCIPLNSSALPKLQATPA